MTVYDFLSCCTRFLEQWLEFLAVFVCLFVCLLFIGPLAYLEHQSKFHQ